MATNNGAPRLAIEVSVEGVAKAQKDFTTLQKELINTEKEFKKANATANEFEGELASLSSRLKSGAISQKTYNKESKEIGIYLASARQASQTYQAKINSLNATIAQGSNVGRQYGNEIKKLQGVHDSVSKGIRGSTSVSLEFSRVLQDAPYGMQGVANNLQQLTTNLGYYINNVKESLIQQGKQASTMNITKSLLGGLLSPMSLVTLGVSALTAGWVLYEKYQQGANKRTKEATDRIDELVNSLGNVATANYKAANSYGSEIAKLDTLYKVATDANIPMQARIKAVRDIKREYPEYFKQFSNEAILAGNAKTQYDELTKSIIATARARAAEGLIAEKSNKQFLLGEANKDLEDQIKILEKNDKAAQKYLSTLGSSSGFSPTNVITDTKAIQGNEKIDEINKSINNNLLEREKLQGQINELAKVAVDNQSQLTKVTGDTNNNLSGIARNFKDYSDAVKEIQQKSQFSLDITSSEGLDKELERNKQKYAGFLNELNNIEKQNRGKNVENAKQTQIEIENARKQIIQNQALEEQQIRIKNAQETQDIITEILNKAGVDRIKSRQQELDVDKNYYDELANKHRNNADILQSITEARKASENSINEKWDNKAYKDAEKLYDGIGKIEQKAFTGNTQEKLKTELDARLKQIEDFYNNIAKVLKSAGVDPSGAYKGMMGSFDKVYKDYEKSQRELPDFSKQFQNTLRRGLASSLDGLFSSLSTWSDKTYEIEQKYNDLRQNASQSQINSLNEMERLEKRINSGITNTLSKLGSTLGSLGGNLLTSAISTGLSSGSFDDLKNMFKGENKASGYGAAASLLGSTLSGIINPSNKVGQSLSGALAGAGTGAAIGSIVPGIGTAIGAIGGALIGGLSSLFGSSARKKQEELAQKQVDLQQKMLALQERQAMLGYQASIIGQMTKNGVVTSIERDAFGELVTNLKGSDIQIAIDRSKNQRK